jgi:hypothetical protein
MAFTDESSKLLVARFLTLDELPLWLAAQPMPPTLPRFFIFHHTYSPTEAQWRGLSSLQGCFNYFRDARGFPYGHGPQFWLSWDGIWIGHNPSLSNQVGAVDWNGYQAMHMEMVHNGDASPLTTAQMAMAGRAAAIICKHYGIPIQWVDLGSNGGALKTRPGLSMHRQLFINGSEPKTCPGRLITQAQLLAATLAAGEDDMSAEAEELTKRLRVSAVAQSYDLAILEAKVDALLTKLAVVEPLKAQELELQRVAAVAKEKERLGLDAAPGK